MTDKKSTIVGFTGQEKPPKKTSGAGVGETIFFSRPEFKAILNLYGKMVASGHWKDYAIGNNQDEVTFSVYLHTNDRPLYQITKTPKLAQKQGAYRITSTQGKIVKRGHDIHQLLKYFNKSLIKLIR